MLTGKRHYPKAGSARGHGKGSTQKSGQRARLHGRRLGQQAEGEEREREMKKKKKETISCWGLKEKMREQMMMRVKREREMKKKKKKKKTISCWG